MKICTPKCFRPADYPFSRDGKPSPYRNIAKRSAIVAKRVAKDLFRAVIVLLLPTGKTVFLSRAPISAARRDKWKIVTLPVVTPTHNNRERRFILTLWSNGEREVEKGKKRGERERLRNRRGVLPFPIHQNIFLHSPDPSFLHCCGFLLRQPPR